MKNDYTVLTLNEADRRKIYYAKKFARALRKNPSYLERKMIDLLDSLKIDYDFQRIIFIITKNKHIDRFYIADFFINEKNLIIEVDGKFHEQQQEKDKARVFDIQNHYPSISVVRWKNEDFISEKAITQLSELLN